MLTEKVDDAAERFVHGLLNRPGHEAETNQVGLVTRALAAVVDVALISVLLSIGSGLLASIIPAISGGSDGLSIWGVLAFGLVGFLIGGSIFVAFWALVGQTPGMRLLSIHLDADGSQEIGLKRALKRIFAVPPVAARRSASASSRSCFRRAARLARQDRRHHGPVRRGGEAGALVPPRPQVGSGRALAPGRGFVIAPGG